MSEAKRYKIIKARNKTFLVSNVSLSILRSLKKHGDAQYEELSGLSGVPVNSLYVFCQRLESAGLIRRVKMLEGKPKRVRTFIRLQHPFEFVKPIIVR